MAEYVTDPYPVRTTIPVALRGFDVEIGRASCRERVYDDV